MSILSCNIFSSGGWSVLLLSYMAEFIGSKK